MLSHSTVELIQSNASDELVCMAAWVSNGLNLEERLDNPKNVHGLINFLLKGEKKHTSPFEHGQFTFRIETPIFVVREWHRHRTQCLAGDTKISFANGKTKTIAKHWEHWHEGVSDTMGRRRILPSVKASKVVTFNEDTLDRVDGTVLDVVKGEPKEMFTIKTSRNFSVKASAEHKFLTTNGWKRLKELESNVDYLYVRHKRIASDSSHKAATPHYLRSAINSWSNSQRGIIVQRDGELCSECGEQDGVVVDHRIPVALSLRHALDLDNLRLVCADCDRVKINAEQQYADRKMQYKAISPDIIVSIESAGVEESYDLVIDEPWHNFLGNGIVTHNSYNEMSGRYTTMKPKFYTPPPERPLVQKGKIGAYQFEPGDEWMYNYLAGDDREVAQYLWDKYQTRLRVGLANEVARMILPLNTYTEFYASVNPLNLMRFLDLRSEEEGGGNQALYEIRKAALQVEELFNKQMPVTYDAWKTHGL